jgi:hypothetical protein
MTDFRDNLYIDKDHPIFRGPLFVGQGGSPTLKASYLASPDSEDAVTWSVFQTLSRIPPNHWLGEFIRRSTSRSRTRFPVDCLVGSWLGGLIRRSTGVAVTISDCDTVDIKFWPHVPAPQSRLLWLLDHLDDPRIQESEGAGTGADADPGRLERIRRQLASYWEKAQSGRLVRDIAVLEGETELDALIEHPRFLVAIEAKYTADLHPHTKWDRERDQLGRVIDIAIELSSQQRKPGFAVLVTDRRSHDQPKLYEHLAPRYQDREFLREKLPHRTTEELDRLAGVGWITWREVLDGVDQQGLSGCDRQLLSGLADYLRTRGLW